MFDTDKIKESDSGRRTRMQVGVHTNVEVQDVEIKETPTGRKLVEVTFVNPTGEILPKTVWIPQDENVRVYTGESKEQAIERERDFFTREAFNMTLALCDDERLTGKTADEFAARLVEKLKKATKKVAVVVQYDKEFQFPEFPKYGWIRPYVEGTVPYFNFEKLRMKKEDTSNPFAATDSASSPGASASPATDLPF